MSGATLLAPPARPLDLAFALPEELAAWGPPEARGVSRDGVRLLVSRAAEPPEHARLRELGRFLSAGDVLAVNASATIAASFAARREDDPSERVDLHLSTPVPGEDASRWVIELRRASDGSGTLPLLDAREGERVHLPAGGVATLVAAYGARRLEESTAPGVRLWEAELALPTPVLSYADVYGEPIRYRYVRGRWPLSFYQTCFASPRERGSAEMPSAGRPFTRRLVTDLERRGVIVAPVVLHTGVSSLESGESPYPERYRVPARTAALVNRARENGGQIVAVGTTVVRALETVAVSGRVRAGEGWTDLVVTPERGLRVVDALITGLHEPGSSHLAMLSALARRDDLARAYQSALEERYLWHEFGDLHLILGERRARWPAAA